MLAMAEARERLQLYRVKDFAAVFKAGGGGGGGSLAAMAAAAATAELVALCRAAAYRTGGAAAAHARPPYVHALGSCCMLLAW